VIQRATDVMDDLPDRDLGDRNRRVRWVLLAIVAALVIGSFLVGIRW
jgi:hypothetical protein